MLTTYYRIMRDRKRMSSVQLKQLEHRLEREHVSDESELVSSAHVALAMRQAANTHNMEDA